MDMTFDTRGNVEGFIVAGGIGLFVKHFIPSDKFNKFIPLVNALALTALFSSRGMDPISAGVNAVLTALAAGKGHDLAVTSTPLKAVQVPRWWSKEAPKATL